MVKNIRCSKCGSDQIYYRLKSKERVCRHCGLIQRVSNNSNLEDSTKEKKPIEKTKVKKSLFEVKEETHEQAPPQK
jgi:transcription initiation factor TFIIIB Brf1 subunit/transcription initiation factor TFIIB